MEKSIPENVDPSPTFGNGSVVCLEHGCRFAVDCRDAGRRLHVDENLCLGAAGRHSGAAEGFVGLENLLLADSL